MHTIIVLDFGGQYCHLISRRIRDLGVYSEVKPISISPKKLLAIPDLKGVIFSGGGLSVFDKTSPKCKPEFLKLGIPVLGICYGHQAVAQAAKAKVVVGKHGEYGLTDLQVLKTDKLLKGLNKKEVVWMNHRDLVKKLPSGYQILAKTKDCPIAAYGNPKKDIYGLQFHPEVTHTKKGNRILKNFVFNICGAKKQWDIKQMKANIIDEIKETIWQDKTIIGLSGGVDSSTAAVLVSKAIGKNLIAVYVDTGLMRYQETEFVRATFRRYNLNLKIVDARDLFFKALKGVTDPEKKRKIIGQLFIDVFDQEAKKSGAKFLIQGTIYSDRIESGITKHSSNIKSHHNVGGLPKKMKMKVYEPLRDLYKDEVRKLAKSVGLPNKIITRDVFPGPGLAIRIIGEVTPERAKIVRKAGYIVEEELKAAGLYEKLWMGFAVLLTIKSVGVQGDARSYKYPVVVRIIESHDAMTANFAKISYNILEKISTRITNEIKEVNRVVYDISNKPPATMEWE